MSEYTLQDLYNGLQAPSRNFLGGLNSNIMGNLWNPDATMIAQISTYMWVNNFDRELSDFVVKYFDMLEIDITNINATKWASFQRGFFSQFINKWTTLYNNIQTVTYNPIWNVEGSESTVHTFEHGKTVTETKDFTIEHGRDSTDTETVTDNITDNDVYGFNSSSPVGATKSTNNGERTMEYTGSDTDTHSGTDTFANSGCDTERITFTRGLNLGMMSTQDLMNQELDFRLRFDYYKIVVNDILSVLSYVVY